MKPLILLVLVLLTLIFCACTQNANIEEENKAAVRNWFEEGWNKHNFDIFDEYFAPDFINSDGQNFDEFRKFTSTVLTAFPDLHITVDVQIAEGDKVATRWTFRGTHQGEFMGIATTGKQVTMTGINISFHANGKCVEDWGNMDLLGLMQQLQSEN